MDPALAGFKETLEAVADAILVFDAATKGLVYANPAAKTLLGREAGDLSGMEARHLAANDEAAKLRAALALRDEILAVASHELRTPLSSLQLQLEMLLRPRKPGQPPLVSDRALDRLKTISRQIGRMTRLVTQLVDVSRMTAGDVALDIGDVDLTALTAEVVARCGDEAARAGCALILDAPAPVRGRWDRERIDQLIANLIAIALKQGPGGPVEIAVASREAGASLSVRDHGAGLPREDAERLLQPLHRAGPRSYAAVGLGLFAARQIADAHGGTIRLASPPGGGSTFTVELPREPAGPAAT